MKILILLFSVFILKKDASGQQSRKFDSVKIYTNSYYGERPIGINQYDLIFNGDSVLIEDDKIAQQFFIKLNAMKKKSTTCNLKKIRQDFTPINMNVRAVFVFYEGLKKTKIGISPQPLMFIDDLVFEKRDKKLEDIVMPSQLLYKNLFPTKGDIINRKSE